MNMKPEPIFVIFDGPAGPESGRFVEVETADGKSVHAAEWTQIGSKEDPCPTCKGDRFVQVDVGREVARDRCPACQGSGKNEHPFWRLGPFYTTPAIGLSMVDLPSIQILTSSEAVEFYRPSPIVVRVEEGTVVASFTAAEWQRELAGMSPVLRGDWAALEAKGYRWAAPEGGFVQ